MSTLGHWYGVVLISLQVHIVYGENQFVRRGDNVTLVCPYTGNAIWNTGTTIINQGTTLNPSLPNKDRLSIVETSTGNMNLHIITVIDADTGNYDCNVGSQLKRTQLKLFVNPNPPSVQNSIQQGSRIQGVEGQVLTITCDSKGGNPPADVTWMRRQTVLATGMDSVSYTWTPVRADDRMDYICQSNSAALVSPLSTTVQLYLSCKNLFQMSLLLPHYKTSKIFLDINVPMLSKSVLCLKELYIAPTYKLLAYISTVSGSFK